MRGGVTPSHSPLPPSISPAVAQCICRDAKIVTWSNRRTHPHHVMGNVTPTPWGQAVQTSQRGALQPGEVGAEVQHPAHRSVFVCRKVPAPCGCCPADLCSFYTLRRGHNPCKMRSRFGTWWLRTTSDVCEGQHVVMQKKTHFLGLPLEMSHVVNADKR